MARKCCTQNIPLSTIFGLCALLATPHFAVGQSAIGLGSTGGFGNFGSSGGATGGGFGGSGSTGGQSGFGGLGGGVGGAASGGAGQTGAQGASGGQTAGLGSGLGASFDPSFGATQMASGLATAAAVSRVTSSLGGGGRGGFGGGFGGGGFGGGRGGFGGNNNNQNAQNQNKVRAVVRIGFPSEGRSSSATAQMVTSRFSRMPLPPTVANVQITMEGRTAVLRGQIDAVEDGKLVERLLSLEPGIDGVKNELVVAGAAEQVPAPLPVTDQ